MLLISLETTVDEAETDAGVELETEVLEVEFETPPCGVDVDVNVLTTCNTVVDAVAGGGTARGGHFKDRGVSARTNKFLYTPTSVR